MRAAARRCLAMAVLACAAIVVAASPGAAQPRTPTTSLARDKADTRKAAVAPRGPLLAVVSIARQRIQVYDRAGVVAQAPVSTGMAGHRTPTGVFSILQRSRFHRSNIYSNAPMPYMQRLTWSGIALHAGVLPGYPASHGCIRMPYAFATELWAMTRLGTRVVVAPDDATPAEIDHPRLPVPRLVPPPPGDADSVAEAAGVYGPGAATGGAAAGVKVADADGRIGPPSGRPVDPYRRAVALKAKAAADAVAAAKAAGGAADAAAARATEARSAVLALRKAESALAMAERRRERAARAAAPAAAPGSQAAERAVVALAAAEEALSEARRTAEEAWLLEAAARQEAFEASSAAAEAREASRVATAAVKAAERTLEPISIFVSRKAGKVFIRQGWVPIHEAPIAFAPEAPPLGTHLYVAMAPDADAGQMRWLSVSLPASPPRRQPRRHRQEAAATPVPAHVQATAASVLGRFEFPPETRRFIEERLWPGASLIVSDHAGSETGIHTDFIVLTR
jgi:lipoprotein-anchoring transpeptidase ErfK/SrfK